MKRHGTRSEKIYKIDGVGVNLERFRPHAQEEVAAIRTKLGYRSSDFIITVVAELNKNKNQLLLVRVVPRLLQEIPNLKVLLIGKETLPLVRDYVESNGLGDVVEFLGYRTDVDKLTAISDIAFSASLREGLPVNIIEAMACGVPVVCSTNRGHCSLIKNMETGFIFPPGDTDKMCDAIILLYKNPLLRKEMGRRNATEAKKYSVNTAVDKMAGIYQRVM